MLPWMLLRRPGERVTSSSLIVDFWSYAHQTRRRDSFLHSAS